ncbi:MAG: hypothetical protein JST64_14595, partial [Actinobacteria bacterium]|nr:hypothetical protein [Actinomycetota bacterium]
VGEWSTCSISHGHGHRVNILEEVRFPHSIGLFYSALTSYCGFAVNDGEYKLMGLAPYGRPIYLQRLLGEVIHIHDDGEFRLNSKMFDYQSGRRMFSRRLQAVLGGPPREPNEPLTQRHADIARSAQDVLESAVLGIVRRARQLTGASALCLGGGVAHNCVASARVRGEQLFDDVWTYPIAGDAGASLGAALWQWHQMLGNDRSPLPNGSPEVVFLGPSYDDEEVGDWLEQLGVDHQHMDSWSELNGEVARHLEDGLLVGWFQGRMEFGPRALGHRSILADPRHSSVVERLNTSVKNRESFRPFAPAILASSADEWFEVGGALPYMAEVAMMRANRRLGHDPLDTDDWEPVDCEPDFAQRLTRRRSEIPACTHVDFSARVQT